MLRLNDSEKACFSGLLQALADAFETEGRPGGDAAVAALRNARNQPYRDVPATSEPTDLLTAACAHPDALPAAASVLSCARFISWTNWEGEGLEAGVSSNLHTAELVGPDGHIEAEGVRVGLLISDSATDYPVSRHSGEETYLVISGTAEWTVDGRPYRAQPPGTLIHHPAWIPHGRRTLGEPFLGAWRWSGDLDLSSFSVDG